MIFYDFRTFYIELLNYDFGTKNSYLQLDMEMQKIYFLSQIVLAAPASYIPVDDDSSSSLNYISSDWRIVLDKDLLSDLLIIRNNRNLADMIEYEIFTYML